MRGSAGRISAAPGGLRRAACPRKLPQDDVHGLPDQDTLIRVDADERSLILRAQDGDATAFSRLVERHWTWLVHFARSVVGDAEAEDCVQDGLVIAWSKLVALRQPDAFRGWILRTVSRLAFRRARRSARYVSINELAHAEDPASEAGHQTADVEAVLAVLAPRQRAVMHLTVIEGMSDSEISAALGIAAVSVRSHRRRARETLRRVLQPGLDTGVMR
jgi:RNA polymerase sigma-70 factor (ECF subfamily)